MKKKTIPTSESSKLHRQAEIRLAEKSQRERAAPPAEMEAGRLLHELQVHQIELEMQNEELLRSRAEVEEGLRHYTDLYDFAPIGYFTLGRDGSIHRANLAGARLLGVERSKLVKRHFGLFVSAASRSTFGTTLEKTFESRKNEACEIALRNEGQETRWVHLEAISEDGQECHAVVVDITERKRAEEKLREAQENYRTLFEQSADAVFILDQQGSQMEANERAAEMLGYTQEEIRSLSFHEISAEVGESRAILERLQKGEQIAPYERLFRRKDGRLVPVELHVALMRDRAGNPDRIQSIARDITERKRMEIERQALLEIMQGVATTGSLQELLKLIHQSLARVIYAENFFAVFWNKSSGQFEEVYAVDRYDPPMPPSKLEKSITAYVFRSGEPLLLNQAKFDELARRGEVELVGTNSLSWLGAPLKTPRETIGVIVVQNYEQADCYSKRDLDFLASVSGQISLALERKLAEESLQRSQAEATHANRLLLALSQAAQAVQRARTMDEVYRAIQDQVMQLGYHATGFEFAPDGQSLVIAHLNYRPDLVRKGEKVTGFSVRDFHFRPRADSIYHRVIVNSETVFVKDTADAVADTLPKRLHSLAQPMKALFNFGQSIFAPLKVGEETIGILSIAGPDLTQVDKPAVTTFARQAAIAIQNARLSEQAQQEIAERVRAEETLRQTSERLNHMLANSPTVIYALQVEGDRAAATWISKNVEPILGYSVEAAMQPDWWLKQIHPEDRPDAAASLEHLLDDYYQHDYRFKRKDGGVIWLHDEHRLLRVAGNQPSEIIGAWTDITERKQAEESLKEYSSRLESNVDMRTRELREAQEKLVSQEKLAVLGQLAGGVGHELRNPLAVINNAVYFLKLTQPEADEKVKQYLGMIEKETHTAEKIITDLLDFARLKAVDREPVPAAELVQRVLARYPAPSPVTVSLGLPASLPKAYVDARQMEQVLGNLVINAFQAMPDGGRLTVSGKLVRVNKKKAETKSMHAGQWLRITVQDSGTGITPENMEKLFEPLFTTKLKGIGLGLAVSRKLVEANGGRIEAESEPGKGSTFTVFLPVKA